MNLERSQNMREGVSNFVEPLKDTLKRYSTNICDGIDQKIKENDGHIGLVFEYPKRAVSFLASKDNITANRITVAGGVIGEIGGRLVAEPIEYARVINEVTKGRIDISPRDLKRLGFIGTLVGYAADGTDGAIAHAKEMLGKEGSTRFGRVLDGFFDKKFEIGGVLSILKFIAESRTEKPGWFFYSYFSNLSTMIRSVGTAYDIKIDSSKKSHFMTKAVFSIGHMISEPSLVPNKYAWRGKGSHGAILTAMKICSTWQRWNSVMKSGNEEAIARLKKDFSEFNKLNFLGFGLGDLVGIGGSAGQAAFALAKVTDVMGREPDVYGKELHKVGYEKIVNYFTADEKGIDEQFDQDMAA